MSEKLNAIFRDRLRKKLEEYDWTQQDLADELGVSKGYVSHLFNSKRGVGLSTLEKLAELFKIDASWFISEKLKV